MLICLILTKSRSAQIGLFVALLVLAWRARGALPAKVLAFTGVGLAVAGRAPGRGRRGDEAARHPGDHRVAQVAPLPPGILGGSLGRDHRRPFSVYASTGWRAMVIGLTSRSRRPVGRSGTFWSGVGPANFAMPYLRHKLPQASEEIQDPHNMVIEVWADVRRLRHARPARGARDRPPRDARAGSRGWSRASIGTTPSAWKGRVPRKVSRHGSESGWLLGLAGLGWLMVWALGEAQPGDEADLLARWLILGAGWGLAVAARGAALEEGGPSRRRAWGSRSWRSINLMAAGGIGIPSVAMSLWVLLALGLNLREDRPCGRLRDAGRARLDGRPGLRLGGPGRARSYGAVMPFWQSESYRMLAGDAALAAKPPAYEAAREAYTAGHRGRPLQRQALGRPGRPRIRLLEVARAGQAEGAALHEALARAHRRRSRPEMAESGQPVAPRRRQAALAR